MVPALVSTHNLSKRWHERLAVAGVHLEIAAGEFIGLVGPNGAGKSTLLRLLAKLLTPSDGDVALDGRALTTLSQRDVARRVALVPPATPADFAFPARDVVLMGRYPHVGRVQGETVEDHAIVREAMALTETTAFADRLITELSSGERQRVALARALAQRPRLLLMDEPTANLDLRHQLDVLTCVQRLVQSSRLTVVAALHDLELAARFCERLLVLQDGRIVADGGPKDVLTPANLRRVFGVHAEIAPHPLTGGLTITVLDAITRAQSNGATCEA